MVHSTMALYQNGRHGTNSVEMDKLNNVFVDMDISAMTREEQEDQQVDSTRGGFWSSPVATLRKNLVGTFVGLEENKEQDDTQSTTTNRTSEETVVSESAFDDDDDDDAGNPQTDDDDIINRKGPLSTFRRNMNTLSEGGVRGFVIARALTVRSNINFCQERAESLTKDLGSLSTFSKNVDFVQARTESITQDVGHLETFSKNVDFAQAKAQSLTEGLASAPSKGGTALRSCLKRTSRHVSVRWKDGYNNKKTNGSNYIVGLDTVKMAPVKSSSKPVKMKKKTRSSKNSLRSKQQTFVPTEDMYILAAKKRASTNNSTANLQKAKLAYERQVLQTEMMYRSIHAQRQKQSVVKCCPASA